MENQNTASVGGYIYFIFQGKRKIQVTREQWEKSWRDWWNKISDSLDKNSD